MMKMVKGYNAAPQNMLLSVSLWVLHSKIFIRAL